MLRAATLRILHTTAATSATSRLGRSATLISRLQSRPICSHHSQQQQQQQPFVRRLISINNSNSKSTASFATARKLSSEAASSPDSTKSIDENTPSSSSPDWNTIMPWTKLRRQPTPKELLATNEKWIADNDPELFANSAKGQTPGIFWLGCCDSRVPAELVTGAAPGDLFVHRNIANTFNHQDGSALAALAYAINNLGVQHVIVCGHHGCGGVQAALESAKDRGPHSASGDEGTEAIQQWLSPIRALAVAEARAASTKDGGQTEVETFRNLVEKNVCAQVSNVASCSVIKNAWKAGKNVTVHGWVYDIATGKIDDLNVGEGTEIPSSLPIAQT